MLNGLVFKTVTNLFLQNFFVSSEFLCDYDTLKGTDLKLCLTARQSVPQIL